MESEKKLNSILRRERQLRGWSQQKVAELVETSEDVVSRWERGERKPSPFFQEKLCVLFGKSAEELGFLVVYDEGKNLKQRDAIKTTSTTGASLIIGLSSSLTASQEIDREIDRLIARKLTRLQSWAVDGLEDSTHLRWQLYYTSRNSLTEDGLLNQIARLEQLADDGGEHYQRVCRILAQNYQLAGCLARDRFQYTKSLEYFQKAEQLHEDIQLPDLTVAAIARQAVALLRKDQEKYLDQSLTLYSNAADKAKHTEPYTQAYVLSGYAEALARKGNYDECVQSLDQAETLLNRAATIPIEEDFAYVCLTLQSLTDSRGECYVLLGKPEKGLEYLQMAQKKLDQKLSRNNCRLLMQQSEAYLATGSPDACVQQALKGLEIARILESTSNMHWASEILTKLRASAFSKESVVDELQEAVQC
jgi:transcriptional regulator with XRE-family HTH domain